MYLMESERYLRISPALSNYKAHHHHMRLLLVNYTESGTSPNEFFDFADCPNYEGGTKMFAILPQHCCDAFNFNTVYFGPICKVILYAYITEAFCLLTPMPDVNANI